jgi:ATP-binding cassette subfamily F protein 3
LVSHDRYFVSKTANKIWEIVDHEIKEFKGGYEEYVEWKERMANQKSEVGRQKSEVRNQKEEDVSNKRPQVQLKENSVKSFSESSKFTVDKNAVKKELQKQQKRFQQLEKQIAELNGQKDELEIALAKPDIYANVVEFKKTETAYKEALSKLEAANKEYEIVFEKIIELDEQLLD